MEYSFTTKAFSKILLHAAKYPHCSVNGVLLVNRHSDKDPKKVIFVESVPLFHLNLTLAPMMEVALTQIDAFCRSKGLMIGGYYQANEHMDNSMPDASAVKITERIQEHFKVACLLMIDNQNMSLDCEDNCFNMYTLQDGKWKVNSNVGYEDDAHVVTASLMHSKAFRNLVDFDNHLDDITCDWSNLHINDCIDHAT